MQVRRLFFQPIQVFSLTSQESSLSLVTIPLGPMEAVLLFRHQSKSDTRRLNLSDERFEFGSYSDY